MNVVAPGMIRIDSLMRAFENNKGAADEIQDRIPMRRFGKPDELASAVLFFASDDASYVTGQLLLVDGERKYPPSACIAERSGQIENLDAPGFQIIVTEHANLRNDWFQKALVEDPWTKPPALVPEDWPDLAELSE